MKIEYKLVDAEFYQREGVTSTLEKYVNEAILQGWRPMGGVSAMRSPDEGYYYLVQAMVRTVE